MNVQQQQQHEAVWQSLLSPIITTSIHFSMESWSFSWVHFRKSIATVHIAHRLNWQWNASTHARTSESQNGQSIGGFYRQCIDKHIGEQTGIESKTVWKEKRNSNINVSFAEQKNVCNNLKRGTTSNWWPMKWIAAFAQVQYQPVEAWHVKQVEIARSIWWCDCCCSCCWCSIVSQSAPIAI